MVSWGFAEIVDLTKDDDFKVVARTGTRPRSQPTATSVVIDLSSDGEDGQLHTAETRYPNQPKNHEQETFNSANLHLQKARKVSSQRETTPIGTRDANLGAFGARNTNVRGEASDISSADPKRSYVPSQALKSTINSGKIPNTLNVNNVSSIEKNFQTGTSPALTGQQIKPRVADIRQPQPQIFAKPYRLHCTECTISSVECDGEQPCSRCVEPGLTCRYPGDPSPSLEPPKITAIVKAGSVIMRPNPPQIGNVLSASTSQSLPSDPSLRNSDIPLTRTSTHTQPQKPTNGAAIEQIEEVQEQFPPCDWTPSTYEDIKDLVSTVKQNLDMEREYWLQNALLQSANRARQTPLNPCAIPRGNPFKKLMATAKQTSMPSNERKNLTIYKGGSTTNASKKLGFFIPTELGWDDKQPVLPPYKSIGRMNSAFVANNIHTIKCLPYFPDDEAEENRVGRENELREKYRNNGLVHLEDIVKELVRQRACLERVDRWTEPLSRIIGTLKLTPLIFAAWTQRSNFGGCKRCDLVFTRPSLQSVPSLSNEEIQRCNWLYKAFKAVTKIHIWHFFEGNFTGKLLASSLSAPLQLKPDFQPSVCVVCCVPNCAAHSLCRDGGQGVNSCGPLINDPEVENNRRERLVSKNQMESSGHICGLYCTVGEKGTIPYSELFGLDAEGTMTGFCNSSIVPVTNHMGFDGVEPCDRGCFIIRSTRKGTADLTNDNAKAYLQRELKSRQISLLEMHTKLFGSSIRLPCSLAKRLKVDCSKAFKFLVMLHRSTASSSKHEKPNTITQGPKKAYQVRPPKYGDRERKKPFVPCSHKGPCKKEYGCQCAVRDGYCEHSCGCDESCHRRFPGCTCDGPCFDNAAKCLCFKYSRECDPWVCKSCGVVEVLDPSNKYNEEIRMGRCKNNRTQLGLPARTVKGSSQIQGWGLFAGEDMPKSTYVGEYKGEIVTSGDKQEAARRGVVYHHGCQEYLFHLNTEQEIDGSRFGNKTRFINHTSEEKVINLRSVHQFVNGIARVSFWTQRDIKAGEEFFYNYGYEDEVTKNFWTVNTERELDPLLPIPKPVLTKTGKRHANQTQADSDEDSEDSEEDGSSTSEPLPAVKNQTKKNLKRKVDDDAEDSRNSQAPSLQRPESRRTMVTKTTAKSSSRQNSERREPSPAHRTDTKLVSRGKATKALSDGEDAEYEDPEEQNLSSAESDSEQEIEDSEDSDIPLPSRSELKLRARSQSKKKQGGLRRVDRFDRRRGGEAQRKAQETRRKNRERSGLGVSMITNT